VIFFGNCSPNSSLRGPHFHALARSIVYQQIATAAATAIYGRVRDLTPTTGFPTADQVLGLSEEELRGAASLGVRPAP
jgi:3-methyladenine DNA glycosylase/8-oxoguanine DNA glycosylase